MCYSLLIKASLPRLASEFGAIIDEKSLAAALAQKNADPRWRFPRAWEREILKNHLFSSELRQEALRVHEMEKERWTEELQKLLQELNSSPSNAKKKRGNIEKKIIRLEAKIALNLEEESPDDERVFPFTFAPVLVQRNGQRTILASRYRVQAPGGAEVPNAYNVFNARRDSLQKARTWRPLFGQSHGLCLFTGFYEWVERNGQKKEILFMGKERELLWAPALVQENRSSPFDQLSFALVTDEPTPEVAAAGHDRCPILLSGSAISAWLTPQGKTLKELDALLDLREKVVYSHRLAA